MTDPTKRQILDDIITEAHHRLDGRSAHVKLAVLEAVRELEGSGHAWVTATLDGWAAQGAARAYQSWRRRRGQVESKTSRGTSVSLPAFAAVQRVDAEAGEREYQQLAIGSLGPDDVEQIIARLSKARDTYSREITLWRDVRELLETGQASTVGEALRRLAA